MMRETVQLAVACAALLVFGVLCDLGSSMISYSMPLYQTWIAYMIELLTIPCILLMAIAFREPVFNAKNFTWRRQRAFVHVAILVWLFKLLFRYSAAWVSGALTQVLISLTPVYVFVFSLAFKRDRYSWREYAGTAVVFCGVIVGAVPSVLLLARADSGAVAGVQANHWYWVLAMAVAFGILGLEQLRLSFAVDPLDGEDPIEPMTALFYYNAYTIPLFFLSIPLGAIAYVNGTPHFRSLQAVYADQGRAFACFLGLHSSVDDPSCMQPASLWLCVHVVGFVVLIAMNAWLMQRTRQMFFPTLVQVLAQTGTAFLYAAKPLVGLQHSRPITAWIVAAFAVVLLGLLVKGRPHKVERPHDPIEYVHINDEGKYCDKYGPLQEEHIWTPFVEHPNRVFGDV